MEEGSDWVVVKKQKITILIPSASPAPPQTGVQGALLGKNKNKKIIASNPSAHKSMGKENTKLQDEKSTVDLDERRNIDDEQAIHVIVPTEDIENSGARSIRNLHYCITAVPCNTSNGVGPKDKHREASLDPCYERRHGKTKVFSSFSGCESASRVLPAGSMNIVKLRLRALNLEKELQRIGGLRRWLSSLQLNRYITVFERHRLGKYQLASLTMSKLKEMGIHPVGPRRKLIHAIGKLCQPYL